MKTLVLTRGATLLIKRGSTLLPLDGEDLAIRGAGGSGPDPGEPPRITTFTVTQQPGFPLVAVATWSATGSVALLDWGGGDPEEIITGAATASYKYNRLGTFTVTLRVVNDAGQAVAEREITITLGSQPGKTFTRSMAFAAAIPADDRNGGLV